MKIVTIVCFSFVIYLDSVRCMTVNEFLNSIPGWGTVRTAWDNMVVAIKKPVNLLRFGHGGRRKTTRSPLRTAKTTTTKFNASTVETIRNTTPHNLEVIPVSAKKVMTTTVVPLKPIITRIRSEKPTRHTKPPDNTKLPLKTETSITPVVTKNAFGDTWTLIKKNLNVTIHPSRFRKSFRKTTPLIPITSAIVEKVSPTTSLSLAPTTEKPIPEQATAARRRYVNRIPFLTTQQTSMFWWRITTNQSDVTTSSQIPMDFDEHTQRIRYASTRRSNIIYPVM